MRRLPVLPTLLLSLLPLPALAQSIVPAADGTGTLVLPDGSTYQITGGTRSGDGANLFHSFEQFGLTAAEVANFLADPTVQNILGRVVGGNVSVINGLLQVSGSSANLFLLNPAGILFGPNSALNLEGSFTATTASGIGFGENWLQAIGDTNYRALTGSPTGFAFGGETGALINLGNLAVNPGEVITLASGAVINLGTLSAPGGQIIVLAVPGENLVSIRLEGAILSLELATLPEGELSTATLPFSPLDIPSLLRAGEPEVATAIAVNPDGTVSLVGASATLPTTPGTALVSGTLDVTGETGGAVQVLGDRIAVTAATLDASGTEGGGQILIGGEYQGEGTTPTADRTYVDASSTLRADAGESGDGGEVIVWADKGTRFDGTITARGGVAAGNGGFVEVSGRDILAFNGRVDVSAAQGEFGTLLLDPTNITISAAASSPAPDVNNSLPDIFAADLPGDVVINSTVLENQAGNIILEATNNISIAPGLSLTFVPGGSITFTADADGDLAGAFTMDTTQTINALGDATNNGRDITISGAGVNVGNIDTSLNTIDSTTNGGNIQITSTNGDINTGNLDTSVDSNGLGNTGAISLNVTGTGNITNTAARAFATDGSSGAITFTTNSGDITAGNLFTRSIRSSSGAVTLTTNSGNITAGDITTFSNVGPQAGAVTLTTQDGAIIVGAIDSRALFNAGLGGAVTVTSNFGPVTLGSVNSTSGSGSAGAINLSSNGGDLTISGPINAGNNGEVTLNNDSGGMTTADIVAGSVSANSFSAQPFSFGNITAAGSIFLANRGSTLTTGNLSTTTGGISVGSGLGGVVTLGTATAGTSLILSTEANGTITTGNLTAGTQVIATTGAGGSLTTEGISSGPGEFGLSIDLQTDEINFLGGAGSVQAPGRLSIATAAAGQPIVLGGAADSGPGALDLTASDLAALANGFSDIVIGGLFTVGTGPITLADNVTLSDPVILRTDGSIDTTGGTLSGIDNASLSLEAGAGVITGAISTQGQPVVIAGDRDSNGDGNVTVGQPITTGGGDIIITGASATDRAIFIDSQGTINSQGGNISLTGTSTGLNEGIITFAPIISSGGAINFTGTSDGGTGVRLTILTGSVDSGGGDITMTGTGADEGILTLVPINSQGGDITLTGTSTAITGTLQGINIQGAVDSQGGAINLTGTSASGHGILTTAVPINSGSGDITFTGTSTGTGIAPGMEVQGAIDSQGGAISFTGTSADDSGTLIAAGSIITSGGGDITIEGTSTGTDPVFDRGLETQGSIDSDGGKIDFTGTSANAEGIIAFFGPITSGGGDITFTGTGTGANATGVSLANSILVDAEGGNLTLTGSGARVGIVTFGGTTLESRAGNLTLTTDNPQIGGTVSGTGNLQIQPITPSLPLTLGGTGAPDTTFLNQDEINRLGNGFSSRTIGQVGNTGPITLQPFTLSSPLTIEGGVLTGPSQDTTFAIAPDGSLEIGGFGAPLRLLNPTEIVGGDEAFSTVLGSAGNDTFTIIGDGTGLLGAIQFSNISAFDGGGGFDTVAGTGADDYFVVTSSNGGYSLSSDFLPDIRFTNVERLATGTGSDTVELEGVPLNLEVIGGDRLTLSGSPDVILNADVTTSGSLDIFAGDIFAGAIAQTGGQVTVGGDTRLFAFGDIDLGGNNDFSIVTFISGQNVTLRDRNNLQLNDLAFSGGLQVTAAGNLTATTNLQPWGMSTANTSADSSMFVADSLAGISLTSGGDLTTANITTAGAPIDLQARGALTTGNLDSSGSNGGAVSLQANRIQVNSINAQGTINGGSITALTSGTFQALGSFVDQNGIAASLSTVGGNRGGAVSLGYGASTFTLGDPSFNGTLGAITTGNVTLLPDVANPILGSRIFGRNLPGQVQFISFGDIPVEIEPPPDFLEQTPGIEQIPNPVLNPETGAADEPVRLTSARALLSEDQFSLAEESANGQFANHFGELIKSPRPVSLAQAQTTLRDIQAQTGEIPAFLYVRLNRRSRAQKPGESALDLLLITGDREPTRVQVLNATVDDILKTQEQLRRQLTNPSLTDNTAYLAAAQQLYSWIIAPIEADLQAAGVSNIGFVMDAGLRTLPLAALHNGEQFLIETYNVGLIPSLGLIDPTYVALDRQSASLLVSGASQFINQPPLLAAEVEMNTLQAFWPGTKVAETQFTVNNLQQSRRQAQIIHLATHAQFLRGAPDSSYLQFFDNRLRLNQMADLGWFDPQVELVTLSACQTAMGNTDAELGFAGFALVAGAKSALASLWKVSDEATAGLMTTFYQTLDQEAIKAEALRQAQLAMIRGQVYAENGQMIWPGGALPLPPDLVVNRRQDFSHPFYWAAFTMVGSPW